MKNDKILVAPSILSADFGNLKGEIERLNATDCEFIHIDIMDGHFVPNLTFGLPIVESIAKYSKKPLDIHLMVRNVPFFIDLFASVKPHFLSIHIEEEKHLNRALDSIAKRGIHPGVVLNPHTSHKSLEYVLEGVDLVLLMSVNPGFGGQSFIDNTTRKAAEVREMIERLNPKCLLEVDGGVNDKTIKPLKASGVDLVVSGSYIFKSKDYQQAIDSLR